MSRIFRTRSKHRPKTDSKHSRKQHVCAATFFCALIAAGAFFNFDNATAQTAATNTGGQPGVAAVLGASTANVEELKRKIEEQSRNIEALNKEIQAYSELKDKTTKEAQTLSAAIKALEQNGKVLDLDIKKTRTEIDKANNEIESIDNNIETSEETVVSYLRALETSLRDMNKSDDMTFVQAVLAKKNLSDTLIEISNRMNFNESVQEQMMSLRNEKITLESNKLSKEEKKKELADFQTALADKKKVVDYNKSEQNKILTVTKNQEQNYQQLLADKQAQKAAFEKELFNYESALKYTLDPTSIPREGSTVLSWPLEKVRITQRFGKTVAAKRLYVSGSHNGVDFGASTGTAVKAALSGTIIGAGDTDLACPGASFGRWVMIRHNNGLSTMYAHLSVISVKEGDVVGTGQTIGYSGNTGYSTGPHLHFGAYVSDAVKVETRPSVSCKGKIFRMPIAPIEAYLDPMVYLPAI